MSIASASEFSSDVGTVHGRGRTARLLAAMSQNGQRGSINNDCRVPGPVEGARGAIDNDCRGAINNDGLDGRTGRTDGLDGLDWTDGLDGRTGRTDL